MEGNARHLHRGKLLMSNHRCNKIVLLYNSQPSKDAGTEIRKSIHSKHVLLSVRRLEHNYVLGLFLHNFLLVCVLQDAEECKIAPSFDCPAKLIIRFLSGVFLLDSCLQNAGCVYENSYASKHRHFAY